MLHGMYLFGVGMDRRMNLMNVWTGQVAGHIQEF